MWSISKADVRNPTIQELDLALVWSLKALSLALTPPWARQLFSVDEMN